MRPVLALRREEIRTEWRRRLDEEERCNVDTPRSQSRRENGDEHSSVSGSPHGSMVNTSVLEAGSVAVETRQPGTEQEFRRQPPSDEYPPSVAITGGPELVDSTPSGPKREPEMPGREDDAIQVTRNDRPAEEKTNKESTAAVEGRSSE